MKDKFGVLIRLMLLFALLLLTSCVGGDGGTPDDNYEPNDIMASAYDLSGYYGTLLSTIDGLGIQADEDWYQIDVTLDNGVVNLVVYLYFTHADGDIDLALYDASGTLLAISSSTTDDEYIHYLGLASGTCYIRVYNSGVGNTYDLLWYQMPVP
jgi:hypothetical protein